MKDNRGLSLVELLITVTIVAIVIVSAAGFMLSGSRSFAKGSADSDVQSESELAVNQIEDLVIDVNGGVSYDDATESLIMYHVEKDDVGVSVYKKRSVTWDKSDTKNYKLLSSEWVVAAAADGSGSYEVKSTVYENELLAEKVTDFSVDLSDKITETGKDGYDIEIVRSVVIQVACLDATGKSSYATTPTITLRNRMMLSADPGAIFDNTTVPDDNLLLYISSTGLEGAVPIRDRVTEVERGKMYNIFAMVSAGTNVNSLCSWQVESDVSTSLSSINGAGGGEVFINLDVDEHEPGDYLTITASYTDNPSKKAVGIVKVKGGSEESNYDKDFSVTIDGSLPSSSPFAPYYVAYPIAPDFTDEETERITYTWSLNVEYPSEYQSVNASNIVDIDYPDHDYRGITYGNNDRLIQLTANDGYYDIIIKVTVKAYSDVINDYRTASTYFIIPSKETSKTDKNDSNINRGKGANEKDIGTDKWGTDDGEVWYKFDLTQPGYWSSPKITGEVYLCDIYGKRLPDPDNLLADVVFIPGYGNFNLAFTRMLPADREFYLKVVVNIEGQVGARWDPDIGDNVPIMGGQTYERIFHIPVVTIIGKTIHLPKGTTWFAFEYEVLAFYENAWANDADIVYEVEEINGRVPDGSITVNFGGTVSRGVNLNRVDPINISEPVDSMKVKVYMKDYPNVYAYYTIIFQ